MTATITDLLDRWNNDEGKPYKGILIDVKAYDPDHPNNIGCMCAQGQVLNIIGGWGFDKLNNSAQSDADTEVAKLLNISRAHSILLRQINDSVSGAPSTVLTSPVDVLGDQWSKILDFFVYLDGMDRAAWNASRGAAWNASRGAAGAAAWNACTGRRMERRTGRRMERRTGRRRGRRTGRRTGRSRGRRKGRITGSRSTGHRIGHE